MASIMTKKVEKNEKENNRTIEDNLYSAGRIGARIAYTTLPAAVYIASSGKLDEIDNFNCFKRFLANIFYRGDMTNLHELNDYAAKATGASAGLLIGYFIDRATEHAFSQNKGLRKTIQPLAYFGIANIANLITHGADSLEGLLRDTAERSSDFFSNITNTGNANDTESFLNAGIATLSALAAVKGANSIARSETAKATGQYIKGIAKEFYGFGKFITKNTLGRIYNWTLGEANEKYEARRIAKILRNRADNLKAEAKKIEFNF